MKKAACRNDRLFFYLYFYVFAIKKYNNWKSEKDEKRLWLRGSYRLR
jgi:hypothetical protein